MASKAKINAFHNRVIKNIKELNGKIIIDTEYRVEMAIETKAGKLEIYLHKPDRPSKIFDIFSRFEDPKKAVEVLTPTNASNLNKYSGKWNIHMQDEKLCLEIFLNSLKEIL